MSVLPSGYFGDLIGYGGLFGNTAVTGKVYSPEELNAINGLYGHLSQFDSPEQINEYYANRELLSYGDFRSALDSLFEGAVADFSNLSGVDFNSLVGKGGKPGSDNNAAGVGSAGLSPDTNQFLNAELAKYYGMDRNTAYQEALSNTAYQRAVKDMQAAGLNPASIFGSGRGSTAGGVAFIGNSNSASGGSSSSSKLFNRDTYGMVAALAGLAFAAATKRPQNFWLGQQSAQGIMQTMNVLDRKFSK